MRGNAAISFSTLALTWNLRIRSLLLVRFLARPNSVAGSSHRPLQQQCREGLSCVVHYPAKDHCDPAAVLINNVAGSPGASIICFSLVQGLSTSVCSGRAGSAIDGRRGCLRVGTREGPSKPDSSHAPFFMNCRTSGALPLLQLRKYNQYSAP